MCKVPPKQVIDYHCIYRRCSIPLVPPSHVPHAIANVSHAHLRRGKSQRGRSAMAPIERIVRPKLSDFPPLQMPSSSGSFGQVTIHRLSDDGGAHTTQRHEWDAQGMSSPRVALKRITVRRPGDGIPENLIREIVALKSIQVRRGTSRGHSMT